MTTMDTLRAHLAALRARALLDDASAPGPAGSALDDAELSAALVALGGPALSGAKLALVRASLMDFDVDAAACRLTPSAIVSDSPAPVAAPGQELTVEALAAMTSEAWADCARWLIEQEGYTIEQRQAMRQDAVIVWKAERAGQRVVVCAQRPREGWPLLEVDARRLTELAAGEADAQVVALTTSEATVGAILTLRAAGGRLLDRTALRQKLASLATAYEREQAQTQEDLRGRAKVAAAARKKLLAALTALEEQSRAAPAAQKATGRAGVRKAATQVREARRLAGQALLAWETLLTDWLATFAERPARDGSLQLLAEPAVWEELSGRADHLKKPLLDALRSLAKTPGDGDLGYGAWRVALGEELAARCAVLRWRAQMIDPAQWQDFASAVSDSALAEATRAENAASHAAARAERAQAHLAERAGVAS